MCRRFSCRACRLGCWAGTAIMSEPRPSGRCVPSRAGARGSLLDNLTRQANAGASGAFRTPQLPPHDTRETRCLEVPNCGTRLSHNLNM